MARIEEKVSKLQNPEQMLELKDLYSQELLEGINLIQLFSLAKKNPILPLQSSEDKDTENLNGSSFDSQNSDNNITPSPMKKRNLKAMKSSVPSSESQSDKIKGMFDETRREIDKFQKTHQDWLLNLDNNNSSIK